jgi:two-component system response regulator HydG
VRVIVASNRKLWEACQAGDFREDLYHRFNEFTISIEPLRQRKSDILFYSEYFLKESTTQLNKKVIGFSDEMKDLFLNYRWPGNLRELRNVVRRSVLITESEYIGTDVLPPEFFQVTQQKTVIESSPTQDETDVDSRAETDYLTIVDVLKRNGFNKKKAGHLLGMNLPTMNKKINTYADIRGFKVTF